MKFLHTADLHIGKVLHDFSMIPDQKYILSQIRDIAIHEEADALVIAGDVYDRAIPSAEAVAMLDQFLTELSLAGIPVLMIAGNHDCGERLSFGSRILNQQGLYIAGGYEKANMMQTIFRDEYGEVVFHLLPFLKPSVLGKKNSQEAVQEALQEVRQELCRTGKEKRHVLITHFFVTEAGYETNLSGAETGVYVGGIDSVCGSLFAEFDYTALGHIHRAQQIGKRQIYYAGSPLKYSFGECQSEKSVNLVTLKEKGSSSVEKFVLKPLHELCIIRGRLEDLICPEAAAAAERTDYIQAQLTNQEELIDPIGTLRSVYPNTMQMILVKKELLPENSALMHSGKAHKGMKELFQEFYQIVQGEEMDAEREKIVEYMVQKTEGTD